MTIPHIHSVAPIIKTYDTGERPVLVSCSDRNDYICKYTQSSGSAYKLVSELIGNYLAYSWGLNVPEFAIVSLSAEHQQAIAISNQGIKLCFGSRFMEDVIDLTKVSQIAVDHSLENFKQLLDIALFDMWLANEDRNANNFNLMININNGQFVPIDFGCIFNTSVFDYPLTQLTFTDSLMYSNLFCEMAKEHVGELPQESLSEIHTLFLKKVEHSKDGISKLLLSIPQEWNISQTQVSCKVKELFAPQWIDDVWENFIDILHTSTMTE